MPEYYRPSPIVKQWKWCVDTKSSWQKYRCCELQVENHQEKKQSTYKNQEQDHPYIRYAAI